jgi:hypothetical protein
MARTIRQYEPVQPEHDWYCIYDGWQHIACVDGAKEAHVMMAAPMLLGALERALHYAERDDYQLISDTERNLWMNEARAAIRVAKGETIS